MSSYTQRSITFCHNMYVRTPCFWTRARAHIHVYLRKRSMSPKGDDNDSRPPSSPSIEAKKRDDVSMNESALHTHTHQTLIFSIYISSETVGHDVYNRTIFDCSSYGSWWRVLTAADCLPDNRTRWRILAKMSIVGYARDRKMTDLLRAELDHLARGQFSSCVYLSCWSMISWTCEAEQDNMFNFLSIKDKESTF